MLTLRQKQSKFVLLIAKLIEYAYSQGYELTFAEAYRTPHEADYEASVHHGIVNSLHTIRLAIDLNLFKDGVWLDKSESFLPLGEWWEKQSTPDFTCAWGGRFKPTPDGNHFSLEHNGVR